MSRGARVRATALLLLSGGLAGCGPQAGSLAYFFGAKPKQIVKAQFTPTRGPLLIFFDDSPALDVPPEFPNLVVQATIDEFNRLDINKNVIPPARLESLKRQKGDFHKMGIREVGRALEAEQVLWLCPREFVMADQPAEASEPATFSVAIKVINARAESSDTLRLWPVSTEGERVSVSIPAAEVMRSATADELMRKMAALMAVELGRLFHDYDAAAEE